jgi:hypothetical protein
MQIDFIGFIAAWKRCHAISSRERNSGDVETAAKAIEFS